MIPRSSSQHKLGTAAFIFLITLLCYSYFYQSGGDNESAHFGQIRAVCEHFNLFIDNSEITSADTIEYHGHFYPNKAPGLTLIGVPIWWILSHTLAFLPLEKFFVLNLISYVLTILTTGVLTALLSTLIFVLVKNITQNQIAGILAALGYGLGTIAFPFATLFFSHQVAAFLGFAPFIFLWALNHSENESWIPRIFSSRLKLLFLSGLLISFAVVCEYPSGIVAFFLGIYALCTFKSWKEFLSFSVGAILGAAPLLLYNVALFGKPLFVAYAAYASSDSSAFPEHRSGFLGVSFPSFDTLYQITFGPQRGLFLLSPWLLLGLPGIYYLWKKDRAACAITTGIVISFLIFNSAYGTSIVFWGGGASVGPRHMLPMIPFLSLLAGVSLSKTSLRIAGLPLIFASMALMLMATATEPRVGYEYQDPIGQLFWYQYIRANFSMWWKPIFSSTAYMENSGAFNLGKLAGLPPSVQLLPLGALIAWLLPKLSLLPSPRSLERGVMRACFFATILFFLSPLAFSFAELFTGRSSRGLVGIVCPVESGHIIDAYQRYEPLQCPAPIEQRVDTTLLFRSITQNFKKINFIAEWRGYL